MIPKTDGDTRIVNALNTVLDDAKSGVIRCPKGSRIILLTDGCTTELFSALKLRDTLSEANSRGISVSTVGFGACDDEYLQNIANMTEGKFVHARDASDIGKAMLRVSLEDSDYRRDLINHRNPTKGFIEYLYGFERLLFIVLLGVAFIYLKSLIIRTNNPDSNIMIAHIIIVAVGAVGIEVGMNIFYFSEWVMRLIMCVCFTLVYLTEKKRSYSYNDDSSYLDGSWSVGTEEETRSYDSYSSFDTSYDDLYK